MTTLKMKYYATGYNRNKIEAGIDEAGRGCLAGPVVAGAVIMPIIDFDLLITHPTPTVHSHTVVKPLPKGVCVHTTSSPAWHCTVGTAGGREAAPGHARKLFSTSKSSHITQNIVVTANF